MKQKKWITAVMMLVAVVCYVSLLFTPEYVSAAVRGAVAEKTYKGHCYALFEDATSWTDAKAKCKKMSGHLVTITSAGEDSIAHSLLKKSKYGDGSIGLYNQGTPDKPNWKWVTGEKITYTNWAKNEPNYDFQGTECRGGVYKDTGKWNDFTDDRDEGGVAYICEWDYNLKLAESNITLDVNDSTYIDYVIEGRNSGAKVTFRSSNTKIVKVSSKGKVVAKQPGITTIRVAVGKQERRVTIIVNPQKVTALKAISNTRNSIKLSWKKQAGITKYLVYMYDTDLEEYVRVRTVDGDFNVATINGLGKNKTYNFKVRAYVESGSKKAFGEFSSTLKARTKN